MPSAAVSVYVSERVCRISLSGMSSLPVALRSRKPNRRRSSNSRIWLAEVCATTTFSRASVSACRTTCAPCPASTTWVVGLASMLVFSSAAIGERGAKQLDRAEAERRRALQLEAAAGERECGAEEDASAHP